MGFLRWGHFFVCIGRKTCVPRQSDGMRFMARCQPVRSGYEKRSHDVHRPQALGHLLPGPGEDNSPGRHIARANKPKDSRAVLLRQRGLRRSGHCMRRSGLSRLQVRLRRKIQCSIRGRKMAPIFSE
jgi:hypothetical protein